MLNVDILEWGKEMTIFNFLSLFGGLALFLYGMHLLSTSLETMSGGVLERTLERSTSSKTKAVLLGAVATANRVRTARRKLDEIAQYLYEKETISGEEVMRILNAQPQLPAGPSADSTNQAQ